MPIRKRMLPMARRARSKRRMRPKRRKRAPGIVSEGGFWGVGWIFGGEVGRESMDGGEAYHLPPLQKATPTSV